MIAYDAHAKPIPKLTIMHRGREPTTTARATNNKANEMLNRTEEPNPKSHRTKKVELNAILIELVVKKP